MKMVSRHKILKAAAQWALRRRKILDPEQIYSVPAGDVYAVGSVWCVDRGWIERVSSAPKYERLVQQLLAGEWNESKSLLIGIATNGWVSLLDGNHRVTAILLNNLVHKYPQFPVQFRFFDVGDVINPYRPEVHWDGSNLQFICYPRGACGACNPCRQTLPEVKELLTRNGF